jgi:hypothetical protein
MQSNHTTEYHRTPDEAFWNLPEASRADVEIVETVNPPKKLRGRPFQKGADSRRHRCTSRCTHPRYQFTKADCSNGFFAAMAVMGLSIGAKLHAAGRWPNYRGRRVSIF